jgi:hypothetical protein
MPRNVYFSQAVKAEQNLYEDLIVESLKIYGQDVYYIPRTVVNRDSIFGEDPSSKFDDAYLIEAYIENTDGFEGAGDLYQKFGLEIRDEATFIISRRQWNKLIGYWNNDLEDPKPLEGDLIFLPMSNAFFEITFVEDEQPFYQLSNLPVYKLQCALYEYSDEQFDTDIELIDSQEKDFASQRVLDLRVTGGNHFENGEIVRQQVVDPTPKVAATANAIINNNVIQSIQIIEGGQYVNAAPTITIQDPAPAQRATAAVEIIDNAINVIEVLNPGNCYTLVPDAVITYVSGGTSTDINATVNIEDGRVSSIDIPVISDSIDSAIVVINEPDAVASTATATGVIANGVLSEINITDRGRGYIEPPTITITAEDADAIVVFGEIQTITKVSNVVATISVSNVGVTGSETQRDFVESDTIGLVGDDSNNTCFITKYYTVSDDADNFDPTDDQMQNVEFELEADGFLDFTETNPFGDPSETY